MQLQELISKINIKRIANEGTINIDFITRSPEEIKHNCIFFDLPKSSGKYGEKPLFKITPGVIITERFEAYSRSKYTIIEVDNAREAYSVCFSMLLEIDYSKIKIIGITGTNGKTSTATMLYHIFTSAGIKSAFIGTGKIIINGKCISDNNYSMTTPDPEILYPAIKRIISESCEFIVMEVSSHSLALSKVTPINFSLVLFTGLSSEHMDFHKSMEEYYKEKEKLIIMSQSAIINNDDKYGRMLLKSHPEKSKSLGIIFGGDFFVTDIERNGFLGSSYLFRTKDFITPIKLLLAGDHNIYNSSMATAAAITLGVKPCICKEALKTLNKIEGRFEIIEDEITVIKDYAHTPFALENLLKTIISSKNTRQKLTIVFGCGGERDKEKRPKMAKIAALYANRVIITDDNSRGEKSEDIFTDILLGLKTENFGIIKDRRLAIEYAIATASHGDIVVVSGKGHEKYMCDKFGTHPFSEDEIIAAALTNRK